MKNTNNTETTTTANRSPKSRKKISAEIIKLSDLEVGAEIEGKFMGTNERPWLDKQTGEEKVITQGLFERENGERFVVFMDSGAKNAVSAAGVAKGDYIVLQKLEMKDLPGGRRVNQYDVFAYDTKPQH